MDIHAISFTSATKLPRQRFGIARTFWRRAALPNTWALPCVDRVSLLVLPLRDTGGFPALSMSGSLRRPWIFSRSGRMYRRCIGFAHPSIHPTGRPFCFADWLRGYGNIFQPCVRPVSSYYSARLSNIFNNAVEHSHQFAAKRPAARPKSRWGSSSASFGRLPSREIPCWIFLPAAARSGKAA